MLIKLIFRRWLKCVWFQFGSLSQVFTVYCNWIRMSLDTTSQSFHFQNCAMTYTSSPWIFCFQIVMNSLLPLPRFARTYLLLTLQNPVSKSMPESWMTIKTVSNAQTGVIDVPGSVPVQATGVVLLGVTVTWRVTTDSLD